MSLGLTNVPYLTGQEAALEFKNRNWHGTDESGLLSFAGGYIALIKSLYFILVACMQKEPKDWATQ